MQRPLKVKATTSIIAEDGWGGKIMLTREWIKQFREQATTADIKLWCLTSTGEWRYIDNDEEIPKGRVQLQVGFSYFDFYNTK